MDPTLTGAQAHQKFGELYRKSRPPELQEKVDRIVAATSDVFVRIQRIEEIDEQAARSKREAEKGAPLRGGPVRGGGGGGARGGAKAPPKKKEVRAGFFERLFGGELAIWGRANGTLAGSGLFSLNVQLSPGSLSVFSDLREDLVVPTIKGFRGAAGYAWELFEPARYNTIIAAFQVFNEISKLKNLFQRTPNPEEWITQTIKLQKYYGMLLLFPEYEKTLKDDLIEALGKREQMVPLQPAMRESMAYLLNLERRRPTLTNIFAAIYSLARKKVVGWDDLAAELKLGRPALDSYRGPDAVLDVINRRISDLKGKFNNRQSQISEIRRLREEYLKTDANGRLITDFLDEVVADAVRRTYGDVAVGEANIAAFKREPHRLLYSILKDFDSNCLTLFIGAVSFRSAGAHSHAQEAPLFVQGLFKKHADAFTASFRESEQFLKKYRDINYSFTDFISHTKTPPTDAIHKQFHEIVRASIKMFNLFARDLYTVLYNARSAQETERSSGDLERFARSRTIPVDSVQPGARHIPYGREELVSATRLNGMKIEVALEQVLHHLYNYLYIFRDPELIDLLGSGAGLEKEAGEYKEELTRLGVRLQ
ncbi:MAG: hypothetical protein K1X75_01025 [Leptospirales bacterium]|nr:hypothetical protein [Leptospirales bacterium]